MEGLATLIARRPTCSCSSTTSKGCRRAPGSPAIPAARAALAIVQATSTGELTPCEASELSRTVASYAETMRVCELEQRLAEMERLAERDRR